MRVGVWIAIVVVAGCGDAHSAPDDGRIDTSAGVDVGTRIRIDAGMDAHASSDAGTDAASIDAASIDAFARDAARADTQTDAAPYCPVGGTCTLPSGAASLCCGGACVDLATDPANCGGCGRICGTPRQCQHGRCVYASCIGAASGSQSTCTLTDGTAGTCCDGRCCGPSDPTGCSECGHLRPTGTTCDTTTWAGCPAGAVCPYGNYCVRESCAGVADGTVCALAIYREGVCCAGACIDPISDEANCGACGNACPAGTGCAGTCITPAPCTDPERIWDGCVLPSGGIGRCCGADCVDTNTDDLNCYDCTIACPAGSSCHGGYLCTSPLADGGIQQAQCMTDGDCPSGHHCLPGVPQNFCERDVCTGVPDGTSCVSLAAGGPHICCGGACVDSWRDPNCGGCGVACPSGVCVGLNANGGGPVLTCLPSASATIDCGGAGGCPPGNACVGGVCVTTSCPYQGTLCVTASGAPGLCCAMGTCVDVSTDPMHCGDCNSRCRSGQTCLSGSCR